MTTDKFGGTFDDNIDAPFERAHDVGAGEGVVADDNDAAFVSEFDKWRDGRHFHRRVGDGFEVEDFCVGLDGGRNGGGIGGVDEGGLDAVVGEAVVEHFVGGAVGGPVADDVAAAFEQAKQGDRNRGHAGGGGEAGVRAVNRHHLLFEGVFGWIAAAAIDVDRFAFTIDDLLVAFSAVLKARRHVNRDAD